MYAIYYTKEGTTLAFWLNRYTWGGYIWSLVRSTNSPTDDNRVYQPPLRFETEAAARDFIAHELSGNTDARIALVED